MLRVAVAALLHLACSANDETECPAASAGEVATRPLQDEPPAVVTAWGGEEEGLLALGDAAMAVRESAMSGAGLGAFALRRFAEGEVVGTYRCSIVAYSAGHVDPTYTWHMNATHGCTALHHRLGNPIRYGTRGSAGAGARPFFHAALLWTPGPGLSQVRQLCSRAGIVRAAERACAQSG